MAEMTRIEKEARVGGNPIRLVEETLADLSLVYNIEIDLGGNCLVFAMRDDDTARHTFNHLVRQDIVSIDIY